MGSPVDEKSEYQAVGMDPQHTAAPNNQTRRSSDEEGTFVGDGSANNDFSHLKVVTSIGDDEQFSRSRPSPSQTREQRSRLGDDLELLRAEQVVSEREEEAASDEKSDIGRSRSMVRSRSRRAEPVDEFDVNTNPLHEKAAVYKPPQHPTTSFAKFFKKVHESSFLIRYFTYISPLVLLLLIPLLLGALVFPNADVGGVKLMWFSIWLEIVWLTLWAGRLVAKALPWPIGIATSLFTNNSKKWRDMGKQLEIPATLFFWWLAIEISFLPTMTNHHTNGNKATKEWEVTMNKVLVSIFVGVVLNFVEKIIIQLIAISFHLRTYADRIDINKFQIGSLAKLYTFSKEKIAMADSEFEVNPPSGPGSGARTPMAYLKHTQRTAREALAKASDVAGKVAGDFTGRSVAKSTHPHQVILMLLNTTKGSQVLARRLYRTFAREETETVHEEDLKHAFDNDDEASAAFQMFDKDMNGDISMEELEAVCVEIGRERKSITASLKDLDSVVGKLDEVLFFIVFVITIIVFISLISTSAAGVLTSLGSSLLALSWLFSATAQEFLQSVIFVFVKHPFDVGDRVSIYGNTGSLMRGDDYFVKEISLLFTEFKKMEGHIVQAPNSYLNTLFILNQRRSGALAEAVPVTFKFGTTLDQIDQLRQRLLAFVTEEKREYQSNILTELRDVVEAHAINLNIVFFYKSNWQNEGLRLQRRNKFICALMVSMQEIGIEGPRMRYPGQKETFPVYLQNIPPQNGVGQPTDPAADQGPDIAQPGGPSYIPAYSSNEAPNLRAVPSIRRTSPSPSRPRGESLSQMNKRVDFSLGVQDMASGDLMSDVYQDNRPKVPEIIRTSESQSRSRSVRDRIIEEEGEDLGRTSSMDSGSRQSFDSHGRIRTSLSTHRNRFFPRGKSHEEQDMMEQGMVNRPHSSTAADASPRVDPRSGSVSTSAVRPDSPASIRGGPHATGGLPQTTPSRSQTFQG